MINYTSLNSSRSCAPLVTPYIQNMGKHESIYRVLVTVDKKWSVFFFKLRPWGIIQNLRYESCIHFHQLHQYLLAKFSKRYWISEEICNAIDTISAFVFDLLEHELLVNKINAPNRTLIFWLNYLWKRLWKKYTTKDTSNYRILVGLEIDRFYL